MVLASFSRRARYLALVLPAFALVSAIHTGCSSKVTGTGSSGSTGGSSNSSGGSSGSSGGSSGSSGTSGSSGCITYGPYTYCPEEP